MQFGFRSKRRTVDRLVKIQQEICISFVNDQQTISISLDPEKTFDYIRHYKTYNSQIGK